MDRPVDPQHIGENSVGVRGLEHALLHALEVVVQQRADAIVERCRRGPARLEREVSFEQLAAVSPRTICGV